MPTCTIQIGNSDDKLPQRQWAQFIRAVRAHLDEMSVTIHFSGGSHPTDPWQNYCWVFYMDSMDDLRARLATAAATFNQNCIALTVGDTTFVDANRNA